MKLCAVLSPPLLYPDHCCQCNCCADFCCGIKVLLCGASVWCHSVPCWQLVEFPGLSCRQMKVRQADTCSSRGEPLSYSNVNIAENKAFLRPYDSLSSSFYQVFSIYTAKSNAFSESLLSWMHPTMWHVQVKAYQTHSSLFTALFRPVLHIQAKTG